MKTVKGLSPENRLNLFAVEIALCSEKITKNDFGIYISNQLMRSGISPALNYKEAQGAESTKDFIHKMKICFKELKETRNFLYITSEYLQRKGGDYTFLDQIFHESLELIKIFVASIKTAKRNTLIINKSII